MKDFILIPARLDSTRLPRKMLLSETGKPLIQHTYENALVAADCGYVDGVYVVTHDTEIANMCIDKGIDCLKIKRPATCGTHACMMAAEEFLVDCNIINIQGDSPDIRVSAIGAMWGSHNDEILSLYYDELDKRKAKQAFRVKLVTDLENRILYYSRSPIPYGAHYWKIHIGAYLFPFHIWKRLKVLYGNHDDSLGRSHLFEENLEQLMWLEHGFQTKAIKTLPASSIDTRKDYEEFKAKKE